MDAALTDRVALALVGAGSAYRAAALAAGLPPTNSDEATMGLMALHVAEGRELPVFFYGQSYMGALEAYLAAPLVLLAGPSTLALRVPTLLLTTAFLLLMWRLTRLLFPGPVVLLTLGLLALGSDRVLKSQLIAGGGYPEILPLAALLLLLAVLAGTPSPGRRPRAYALVAGAAVGALPLAVHTVGAGPGEDPLSVFLRQTGSGAGAAGPGDHLAGGVLTGVPLATGLCPPGTCTPLQAWWGAAYLLLLVAAAALAVAGLRRARQRPDRDDRHEALVRHAARLALVAAAAVTVVSYARSSAAVETPTESARYLTCLLVSTPAALWPLVVAARHARERRRSRPVLRLALAAAPLGLLAAVVVLSVAATVQAVATVPRVRAEERDRRALAAALDRAGATRVYSDYWTCNRLVFATRERILCSTLDEELRTDNDRYAPYSVAVREAARPVYALEEGSAVEQAFARHLRSRGLPAATTRAGGYRIYEPAAPAGVPLGT